MLSAAKVVGVAQRITAAVNTRALAVPDGKDTIVCAGSLKVYLLCATYCSGRQFFVDSRLEYDVVLLQEFFSAV